MAVDVVITDVNDNAPRFDKSLYNAEITEHAAPQRNVVVVRYEVSAVSSSFYANYILSPIICVKIYFLYF